ncbi:MAG: hypothetical protein ACREPM_02145 [Gemmatimonadaceae bacterium]
MQIEQLRSQMALLAAQVSSAEEERASNRRVLQVLSTGDTALEEGVRDLLRRLGAHVIDPTEGNKEDGWITVVLPDGSCSGVLEIKSTQRPTFDESGLKQLAQWKERGRAAGNAYKGIFIGNSAYGSPPEERPNPFGDGFRKTASAADVVALTTATLLEEFRRVTDERMEALVFWRALFNTRGVYEHAN